MKRPAFMEGTPPLVVEALQSKASAPQIRGVSWAPSPPEPALPQLKPQPAPTPPPAAAPVAAPPPAFEPLASAPPPPPAPPPVDRHRESITLALEALKHQGERLAEQARSDALELGILIARRILEQEITANLDGLFALIKSAIRRAGEDHVTRVRLNPGDVQRFTQAARSDFSLGKIELVGDPTLTPGDVMVETEHHAIDGRLATRFEELVKQLEAAGP